jgi:hypothetical protein
LLAIADYALFLNSESDKEKRNALNISRSIRTLGKRVGSIGSAACVANCLTISFRSTSIIFAGLVATTLSATIKAELIGLNKNTSAVRAAERRVFAPELCPHADWRPCHSLPLVGSSANIRVKSVLMTHRP